MRVLLFSMLAAMLMVLINGCREKDCFDPYNPDCVDYDPCLSSFSTNAEFGFWKKWGIDVNVFHFLPCRDTIPILEGNGQRIYFRAADSRMSAYEWQIGQDPRVFTDSLFYLDFYDASGWVNVSLKVSHDDYDSTCFPSDEGEAIIEKSFYLKTYTAQTRAEELEQYPIFGEYLGYNESSPQDTFRINIDWPLGLPPGIYNFPEGCSNINNGTAFTTHYFYVNARRTDCLHPTINATLMEDNRTLMIDYSIEVNGQRENRKWVGFKL